MIMLPMTLGDPEPSKTTPISTFCVAFQMFVVGEHTDFKFDGQVDHIKCQPTDDKSSLCICKASCINCQYLYLVHSLAICRPSGCTVASGVVGVVVVVGVCNCSQMRTSKSMFSFWCEYIGLDPG